MKTIFYSWQSDLPNNSNRNFIEDSIKKAIKTVSTDLKIQTPERGIDIHLDKDTKDTPGIPPITATIFQKISNSLLFIPDLTFVGKTPQGRLLQNPNVLIEYGYALKSLSHQRIVPVINTAFGEISGEALPFDMRHLRHPITYHLTKEMGQTERSQEKEKLVKSLVKQIHLIVKQDTSDEIIPSVDPLSDKRNKFKLFYESQEYTDLSKNQKGHGFTNRPKQALYNLYLTILFFLFLFIISIYYIVHEFWPIKFTSIIDIVNLLIFIFLSFACICVIIGIFKRAQFLRKQIHNGEKIIQISDVHIFPALVVNIIQKFASKDNKLNDSLLVILQIDPKDPNSLLEIEQPIHTVQGNYVRFLLHEIGVVYSKRIAKSTRYSDIIEFSRTKIY